MVKYKVDLAKPGLPADILASGLEDISPAAIVVVGPDKTQFQFPIKHLSAIEHFDRALNGGFQEAEIKTIEMADEDPAAFRIFARWLYRGIDNAADMNVPIQSWVRLLIMADKWCLSSFALEIAKHVYNDLIAQLEPGKWSYYDAVEAYKLLADLRYRYVIVHCIWINVHRAWPESLHSLFADSPAFFRDSFFWNQVMSEVSKHTPKNCWSYGIHAACEEDRAHVVDKILLPVLFDAVPLSDVSISSSLLCKEVDDRREFLRKFLRL